MSNRTRCPKPSRGDGWGQFWLVIMPAGVPSRWLTTPLRVLTLTEAQARMVTLMVRPLKRTVRRLAGVLLLAFAFVSSAECVLGSMSAEEMACCAAMKGDCDMSITSSCCTGEVQNVHSLAATKPVVEFATTPVLVAILPSPLIVAAEPRRFDDVRETSSASPPGVSTYLFVSSFRI